MRQVQYTYYNTLEFDVSMLNYYTTILHNVNIAILQLIAHSSDLSREPSANTVK